MEGSLNLTRLPLNANADGAAGPEEGLGRGQVYDRQPSVSPDGRSVAYISNRLGHDELWILRLGTKRLERLKLRGNGVGVIAAHWFPDGQRLASTERCPME